MLGILKRVYVRYIIKKMLKIIILQGVNVYS